MLGFTSQMLATRTIPDKGQSQVWTPARKRRKGFKQFLNALRGIQTSDKQHKFGLIVYGQLRARRGPVSQVKDGRIATIPDRPDLGGADTHLDGSLAEVLTFGYNKSCALHREPRQPPGSRVDETI